MHVDATRIPQVFCDFRVVAGHWQPFFDPAIFSLISLYIRRESQNSRDGSKLELHNYARYTKRVIGLLGRFKWIAHLFQDARGDLLQRGMGHRLTPALFYVEFAQAVFTDTNAYIILYLPANFPPNHPQFEEVSQYAYTWMRRACTCTFFVPDGERPETRQVGASVHGVLTEAKPAMVQFYGAQATLLLTVRETPPVQTLTFDDVDDLFSWLDWLSPRYRADFSKLSPARQVDGPPSIALDAATLGMVRAARTGRGAHALSMLFYQAERRLSAADLTEHMFTTQQGGVSELIAAAANLTIAAHNADPGACVVCEDLAERTDEQLTALRLEKPEGQMCADCRVLRLETPPRTDANAQLLENSRKAQISPATRAQLQNEKRAFIARQDFFVNWFLEYWACYCL
jgi:hypothetical protein